MFAIARSDFDGRVVNGVAAVVLAAVLIGTPMSVAKCSSQSRSPFS